MFFGKVLTVVCIIILFSCDSNVNSAELLFVPVESTTPVAGDELQYFKSGLAKRKGVGNVMLDVYRVLGDSYPNAKFTASSMETLDDGHLGFQFETYFNMGLSRERYTRQPLNG
ncbi:MAG: hypothetical protein COA42_19290 [Alteromonadaceae bacterium]|nr:MAG: hypothetical protein COA42_19290 [Alteromonadaceae bacterium]